jgi:hypothetical protein
MKIWWEALLSLTYLNTIKTRLCTIKKNFLERNYNWHFNINFLSIIYMKTKHTYWYILWFRGRVILNEVNSSLKAAVK